MVVNVLSDGVRTKVNNLLKENRERGNTRAELKNLLERFKDLKREIRRLKNRSITNTIPTPISVFIRACSIFSPIVYSGYTPCRTGVSLQKRNRTACRIRP